MTTNLDNITFSPTFDFPDMGMKWKIKRMFALLSSSKEKQRVREEKFSAVMREYNHIVSGICFSYSSNADDMKDLRQDIMINIWKGLPSFKGESSTATWIYRVALNTCVSTVRKRSRKPATVPIGNTDVSSDDNSDFEMKERIEQLHSLISELSPLDKAVITMWLDERKYEEIAEVTGLSRNNVAVRINRIKKGLAEKI